MSWPADDRAKLSQIAPEQQRQAMRQVLPRTIWLASQSGLEAPTVSRPK